MSRCRFCDGHLEQSFANLGMSPLANSYLKLRDTHRMERFFPLHAFVCENCWLVQLDELESPERIFGDYSYFSSFSDSWLKHCQAYTEEMKKRFALSPASLVAEVASNDGYLLQYFHKSGIPVVGVEPAANVAQFAIEKGIRTEIRFFGKDTARQLKAKYGPVDLIAANNVMAHVPDLKDFVAGFREWIKPQGVITVEFPHLMELVHNNQFDTIYHEHFSYFSFTVVRRVFQKAELEVFDVQRLQTHGGSLRVFATPVGSGVHPIQDSVPRLLEAEKSAGVETTAFYSDFAEQVRATKRNLLSFLIQAKKEGKRVVGYGAPAKGNTLLNYCGIRSDFLDFTVDRSPHKQGMFLPGTHVPIESPEKIFETQPDYVLILPWNLREEISEQMAGIRKWGGRFVVPIPKVEVF